MALLTDINNLTKKIYKKGGVTKLIPDEGFTYLLREVPFRESQKIGEKYVETFELSLSGGFTFHKGDEKVDLNDAASMSLKKAEIDSYDIHLTDDILIKEAASAMKKGEKAFEKATGLIHSNMMKSMSLMLESQFLYGQSEGGLGILEVDSAAEVTSTTVEVVVTEKTFASGLFLAREGFKVHLYNGDDDALVSSGADAVFTIQSIDVENRKLVLAGTATGVDAVVADVTTDDHDNVSIHWYDTRPDSSTWNEQAGLVRQISNTGDLFGINASTYSLFRGLDITESGSISYSVIMSAIAKAINRGLMEKVVCLLNSEAWQKIADTNAGQQRFQNDTKVQKKGANKLVFLGLNGDVEVVPHPMVKTGDCIILPKDAVKRIGASDLDFQMPGEDTEIWYRTGNNNYFSTTLYSSQVLFVCKPNNCVYLHGFTV